MNNYIVKSYRAEIVVTNIQGELFKQFETENADKRKVLLN